MKNPDHPWPYFAILAVALCVLAALLVIMYRTTTPPGDRHLKGCLEWCQVHGVYDTPEEYLDCANRCEVKLNEKRP